MHVITKVCAQRSFSNLKLAVFLYNLFIYLLEFYVAFNTVQVISRRVVGRAEETSTYSSLGFRTVNCRPTASNYQLSHLRPSRASNPGLRGGSYFYTNDKPKTWLSPLVNMASVNGCLQGHTCVYIHIFIS